MRRINPDIDDLAKNAADHYPLKTDSADWTSLQEKLYNDAATAWFGVISARSSMVFAFVLLPIAIAITVRPDLRGKGGTQGRKGDLALLNRKETTAVIHQVVRAAIGNSTPFYVLNLASDETDNRDKVHSDEIDTSRQSLSINRPEARENEVTGNKKKRQDTAIADKSSLKDNENNSTKRYEKKSGRLYVGAVIAPELTSVRLQPSRKSINAGIIMGYVVNKRWQFEAGAVLAKKYYYTDGKYVAPHSIRQDNSKILSVYANSSITEIPLTVQYNLRNNDEGRMFISTGMVSYIIHKEHFNYTYSENGEEKQGLSYYNKAQDSWLTNIELSMGIERSVAKSFELRAEPYVRVPIHGIGRSDVPVTSIGLNIAITKTIK